MIDRRSLIQSAPIAALSIGATAAASDATDPHIAWVAEHKAGFQSVFAPDAPDLEPNNSVWVQCKELEKKICRTPASTPKGAAAQLEFALSDEANFDLVGGVAGDLDGQVLANVLGTLQSLSGKANRPAALAAVKEATPIERMFARWEKANAEYNRLADEGEALLAADRAAGSADANKNDRDHERMYVDPAYLAMVEIEAQIMEQPIQGPRDLAVKVVIALRVEGAHDDEQYRTLNTDALRLLSL